MPDYSTILSAIRNYYEGSGNPIWEKIQLGTATAEEVSFAYSQIPQMQAVTSPSGVILGYDYADPVYLRVRDVSDVQSILDSVNSNAAGGSAGGSGFVGNFPVNTYGSSGNYSAGGGAVTGAGSVLATVADKVSLAAAGVSLGTKLGASIDRALYNLAPDWWDEHYPTINPATWSSIATTDAGKFAIRTLFGTAGDEMTAYMSSDMLAYTYMMLRDLGAFETSESITVDTTGVDKSPLRYPNSTYDIHPYRTYESAYRNPYGPWTYYKYTVSDGYVLRTSSGDLTLVTTNPNCVIKRETIVNNVITSTEIYTFSFSSTIVGDITVYSAPTSYTSSAITQFTRSTGTPNYTVPDMTYLIYKGRLVETGPIDGINPSTVGTSPSPTIITGTTVDEVIAQLRQNYPDLFTGSVHTSTLQDDGTLKDDEYVPVPWPSGQLQTSEQTTTGEATQTDTTVDNDTIVDLFPPTNIPNPPDTGEGDGPAAPIPVGNASSLWAVYNPTQSEVNSFGSWLWSSNFVEQLKKLFNDPMQAIIGIHKVFATPPTGGTATIVCGYLDSGVSSKTVSNQYTTIDCGTVKVNEYFGNVFDYAPYTKVSAYLPFIGVVPLNVSEVMRSSVHITYGVDVITGACLAKIEITRDGYGAILYSYGGSCACHYPISSGSYAGIISGVISAAVGVGAGIATGNPLSAVGGIVSGIKQAHTSVEHSGGFTGCSGAMGPKKPYLIIERPQTKMALAYEEFEGIPTNSTVKINECTGYARFKEVHLSVGNAYDDELNEIETLLKTGVLI